MQTSWVIRKADDMTVSLENEKNQCNNSASRFTTGYIEDTAT